MALSCLCLDSLGVAGDHLLNKLNLIQNPSYQLSAFCLAATDIFFEVELEHIVPLLEDCYFYFKFGSLHTASCIHFCKITSALIKREAGRNIFLLRLLCVTSRCVHLANLHWLHPHKDDLSLHISKAKSYLFSFFKLDSVSTHGTVVHKYSMHCGKC